MLSPTLTIAIPTFNRAAKLRRLLTIVQEEIATSRLQERVAVLVSDNASADETSSVVSEFADGGFNLVYCKQPENLGFDGNLRFLYAHATTQYVWYMADDDFPLKGAVVKIVTTLDRYDPDVVVFSFIQPPGSAVRQFSFPEPIRLVTDPVSAIEHALRYPKLSIYVLRKVSFGDSQWQSLDENLGGGWYFIPLAFSVLEASRNLRLVAICEPLATCDEDFMGLAWVPIALLSMHKPVQHPFVLKHHPRLVKFYYDEGYYQAIQFSFAAKTGGLLPVHPQEYDQFIKDLEFRVDTLLRHPKSLLQFMALKLRIADLWPPIRPTVYWVKRLFASRRGKIVC